jgi:hypothetical protein
MGAVAEEAEGAVSAEGKGVADVGEESGIRLPAKLPMALLVMVVVLGAGLRLHSFDAGLARSPSESPSLFLLSPLWPIRLTTSSFNPKATDSHHCAKVVPIASES